MLLVAPSSIIMSLHAPGTPGACQQNGLAYTDLSIVLSTLGPCCVSDQRKWVQFYLYMVADTLVLTVSRNIHAAAVPLMMMRVLEVVRNMCGNSE